MRSFEDECLIGLMYVSISHDSMYLYPCIHRLHRDDGRLFPSFIETIGIPFADSVSCHVIKMQNYGTFLLKC